MEELIQWLKAHVEAAEYNTQHLSATCTYEVDDYNFENGRESAFGQALLEAEKIQKKYKEEEE